MTIFGWVLFVIGAMILLFFAGVIDIIPSNTDIINLVGVLTGSSMMISGAIFVSTGRIVEKIVLFGNRISYKEKYNTASKEHFNKITTLTAIRKESTIQNSKHRVALERYKGNTIYKEKDNDVFEININDEWLEFKTINDIKSEASPFRSGAPRC